MFRKILFATFAVIALILIALMLIPERWIGAQLMRTAEHAVIASGSKGTLSCTEPRARLRSMNFSADRCQLRYGLFTVELDAPTVQITSVLNQTAEVSAGIFGSRCSITATQQTARILPCTIELNKVPQLSALGVTAGTLYLSGTANLNASNQVESSGTVRITELSHPEATPIPFWIRNLIQNPMIRSLITQIPAIERLSADLSFRDRRDARSGLSQTEITLASLAEDHVISGQGSLESSKSKLKGRVQFTLSELGIRQIGPFLPLLGAPPPFDQPPDAEPVRRYEIELSGSPDRPQARLKPLE